MHAIDRGYAPSRERWLLLGAILLGIGFPIFLLLHAHATHGGVDSLPLDDAWIHLTYARNFHDHHSFAYTPGEAPTQGSTSPLYTLLLSLGFGVTRNEKTLSYALGLIFQLGFLAVFGAWARRRLGSVFWAACAVMLIGLDGRIGALAVSGMETSLFLFLFALALHGLARGRAWQTSLALGLAVWTRPDGLLLVAIVAGVVAFDRWVARRAPAGDAQARSPQPSRSRKGPLLARASALLPIVLLLAAYGAFNLALGGSALPNTFGAKRAYYAVNPRALFLRAYVPQAFFTGAWIVLLPFGLLTIVREARRLFRREPGGLRAEALWVVALPAAYLFMLPHAHRFSRYLVPALPALCILAIDGVRRSMAWIESRRGHAAARERAGRSAAPGSVGRSRVSLPLGATAVVLAAAFALLTAGAVTGDSFYREMCLYHWARHERTGRWLAQNTPTNAVIATHDVGAIAFYSGRKVVDMLGVVQREVVPHIHRPDYLPYIQGLFAREKVTHLVVLRSWWEVANVEPLFVADPHPELLEVYPWIPGRTNIMPESASAMNRRAREALRQRNPAAAQDLLSRSLSIDPESSQTWLLAGATNEQAGRWDEAESAYRRALELFPGMADARFRLAIVLRQSGRLDEARGVLKSLRLEQPDYPGAAELERALAP